jgi:uncharacterized phage protein gp47/JayE
MAGITQYGFVRKTLQEIITSMQTSLRNKLGDDWNFQTGSIEDQFISVFAEEADQIWQGLEGVVNSQTLAGAEYTYLDDVLNKQGVYRQDKTKGGGEVIIQSNYGVAFVGTTVAAGSIISARNNVNYVTLSDTVIDNYSSCYRISVSDITVGVPYTFRLYNSNSPTTKVFTRTATSTADRVRFLNELCTFINEVIIDTPSKAFLGNDSTLYVGYNPSTLLPQPFPSKRLYVNITPRVGIIGHSVDIEATVAGFKPLSANGLLTLSPNFFGYDSIVNYVDLNSGSEVQTDAQFRLSATAIKDNSVAGTPDALKSALLRTDGVIAAEVFENPTKNYIYDVSSNLVCEPYTYNVVVLGGKDAEVAKVIYEKGYGNTNRFGNYSTTLSNSLGQSVVVKYTRCGYFDIAVEVGYTTKDGSALTDVEKQNIISALVNAVDEVNTGDYVFNNYMNSLIYQSLSFGRLKKADIVMKDMTISGSDYTTNDLLADFDEKPRLTVDNVTFRRI